MYRLLKIYNHSATGCTKLEMYKIGNIQAGNVQNWKCTTTLLPDVQTVHNWYHIDLCDEA